MKKILEVVLILALATLCYTEGVIDNTSTQTLYFMHDALYVQGKTVTSERGIDYRFKTLQDRDEWLEWYSARMVPEDMGIPDSLWLKSSRIYLTQYQSFWGDSTEWADQVRRAGGVYPGTVGKPPYSE